MGPYIQAVVRICNKQLESMRKLLEAEEFLIIHKKGEWGNRIGKIGLDILDETQQRVKRALEALGEDIDLANYED